MSKVGKNVSSVILGHRGLSETYAMVIGRGKSNISGKTNPLPTPLSPSGIPYELLLAPKREEEKAVEKCIICSYFCSS